MLTNSMQEPGKRGGLKTLRALAVLLLLAAPVTGTAQDRPQPAPKPEAIPQAPVRLEDRMFAAHLQAGYRGASVEDNRTFLEPYDPLESSLVLGLDLRYLKPSFGALSLEAGFQGSDDWGAAVSYDHAAAFDIEMETRKFTHARAHNDLPVAYNELILLPPAPPSAFKGESQDANPGTEYADTLSETRVALKVRTPGYPAHLSASGRVYRNQGSQQMVYFFRSCSTSICHVKSRDRALDQETQEYALGADAHAGPVDIAYKRTFLTFRDKAEDPVDTFGGFFYVPGQSSNPGDYPHDVNPDLRSFKDELRVNSNLANRGVVSLAYARQEQENESSGVTRGNQHAAFEGTYLMRSRLFAIARLTYDDERTLELSKEARATRVNSNNLHIKGGQTHIHALEPSSDRWAGEVGLRYVPQPGAKFLFRAGYGSRKRSTVVYKSGKEWDYDPLLSKTTHAALDGSWRFGRGFDLDGSVAQEWTADPAFATEATSLTRYGLGATWTPDAVFSLRLGYAGYLGTNDDEAALERAYAKLQKLDEGFSRKVTGNAVNLLASYTPAPAFTLTAAYSWSDNGIEADMRFGTPSGGQLSHISPDTAWSGRTQVANLRAVWAATSGLKLTGEGIWVSGTESYDPDFATDADLEQLSTRELTKLYAALGAELGITKAVGLTIKGFWTAFDDRQNEKGDGHALGILAAVDVRW